MPFEKFLTNLQSMFTGFADNEEVLTDGQKIRLLFEKVQSPSLTQVKSSLQISYDLDQTGDVTFDFIANSMAAEAASVPDMASNRQVSEIDTSGRSGGSSAPTSGVRMPDGSIFTGFYKNFSQLSKADLKTVFDERERLGIKKGHNKNSPKKRNVSSAKKDKSIKTMTREIASLKVKFKELIKKESDGEDEEETQDNAGDQFGGRKQKKAKKGE